ncbi:S66 peptidase family protein [Arsenicibacter rosenii]|uniref:LD-carboxypeptidase n=1 Tax=Arsenicibacter rosenii TaxID=1750698 RepID=A0A1S2VM79_9BACT|nr:LD-carboxypeptidase [Arsenicibacter rosenii]OIN59306.1 LD-carboxypeptidase [Arsenicibacter rosenii]
MITPPFLAPGDTVGIVAPASRFPYQELQEGLRLLRQDWQLNVIEGESVQAADGPFAGSDTLRRDDLQRMLDNPEIKAVFAARGGYGCYRIVDQLNLTAFRQSPKWLVGFSDVTVLHSWLTRHGVVSLHGIMPKQFGNEGVEGALASLKQWLFGKLPAHYAIPSHPLERQGLAEGQLIGGNLTLLINSLDTPTDLDYRNKILFIEDIDETLFSLDRMMCQLKRSGRLAELAGLVAGQFTDMQLSLSLPFEKEANQIIADAVAGYEYPVCYDFPAGHVAHNLTLPLGRTVRLQVDANAGNQLRFI